MGHDASRLGRRRRHGVSSEEQGSAKGSLIHVIDLLEAGALPLCRYWGEKVP
jgi:hypothetical protein